MHTREFGSQITNVLRCLQLEAHGYQVSVTELMGWEHSMKNDHPPSTRICRAVGPLSA
ncbi:MAG: SAM-dependent methyltransferase [uncultured Paraburkholderia sp.]|nr:MAG: SAM-dependent methyltransferase [uncultured Paraburkholderia sp.]CAH2921600.1 MAG: SAM-dependent methyltransferase [uncultured Paraburkholderia sp.]